MQVRQATDADIPEIQAIYAWHVLTGTGTFEEEPPSVEDMRQRLCHIGIAAHEHGLEATCFRAVDVGFGVVEEQAANASTAARLSNVRMAPAMAGSHQKSSPRSRLGAECVMAPDEM